MGGKYGWWGSASSALFSIEAKVQTAYSWSDLDDKMLHSLRQTIRISVVPLFYCSCALWRLVGGYFIPFLRREMLPELGVVLIELNAGSGRGV